MEVAMEDHTITWRAEVCGDVKISAETAEEAKTLLASMSRSELLKLSNIWQHEKPVLIDTVDTKLGTLDQETWETIYE
jgi:hypothetical protein